MIAGAEVRCGGILDARTVWSGSAMSGLPIERPDRALRPSVGWGLGVTLTLQG